MPRAQAPVAASRQAYAWSLLGRAGCRIVPRVLIKNQHFHVALIRGTYGPVCPWALMDLFALKNTAYFFDPDLIIPCNTLR
jgi:hypothetical protein